MEPASTTPAQTSQQQQKQRKAPARKTAAPQKTLAPKKRSAAPVDDDNDKTPRNKRSCTLRITVNAGRETQGSKENCACLHCEVRVETAREMGLKIESTNKGTASGEECQACEERGLPCSLVEYAQAGEGQRYTEKQLEKAKVRAKWELALEQQLEDMETRWSKQAEDVVSRRAFCDTTRKPKTTAMNEANEEVQKYRAEQIQKIDDDLEEQRSTTWAKMLSDLHHKLQLEHSVRLRENLQYLNDEVSKTRAAKLNAAKADDHKELLAWRMKKEADLEELMSLTERKMGAEIDAKRARMESALEAERHRQMTEMHDKVESERSTLFSRLLDELRQAIVSTRARDAEIPQKIQQFEQCLNSWKIQIEAQERTRFEQWRISMESYAQTELKAQVEAMRGLIVSDMTQRSQNAQMGKLVMHMAKKMNQMESKQTTWTTQVDQKLQSQQEDQQTKLAELMEQMEKQGHQEHTPAPTTVDSLLDGAPDPTSTAATLTALSVFDNGPLPTAQNNPSSTTQPGSIAGDDLGTKGADDLNSFYQTHSHQFTLTSQHTPPMTQWFGPMSNFTGVGADQRQQHSWPRNQQMADHQMWARNAGNGRTRYAVNTNESWKE
ncbi:hypothetical protein AYO20_08411 [Fonsecaea nubica]|uniref:Uncharacterized protein n=1 Tax=Fonsecaea nubica TaxID=856822 RepID=A0A178CMN1_9EURO|nr:hypothetical protein AYO20_08411 [Fonsecaea nubica]OAL31080.1 hypothetical protein AYO20_08411 [Fonsecaea nubica]